ncbi:ATP/GTP-binding protein [Nonomuraea sp. NPDC049784]|uniref:GTP-binding protein n=1 Tax=Nonomuraea sp. NPDC049784 TaxID=3154361 RepID=UPI0033E0556C
MSRLADNIALLSGRRSGRRCSAPSTTADAVRTPLRETEPDALNIVIVGGFGVGKTTMVGSLSEIRPLSTEEVMTQAGEAVDDASRVRAKTTTTVAFDFGRITVTTDKVVYLFGAPGQQRFWYVWDQLFADSLGAVVLVDTRRLQDSWYSIDRLEHYRTPFVVAVNRFADGPSLDSVREALALSPEVPLIECDARKRPSCKHVLITLVKHIDRTREGRSRRFSPASPMEQGTADHWEP